MSLNKLFNPRTVALIGASGQIDKVGYSLAVNLLKSANQQVYLITLSSPEILGRKTFRSILEVPDQIDLAIIAVPSPAVAPVITQCAQKQVSYAVIISAGFREIGKAGLNLENQLKEIARQGNLRLLGPNCFGLINNDTGLNATFATNSPNKGSISFLTQSGALCTSLIDMGLEQGIGFSKIVSLGNKSDLNEIDFLEYFAQDDQTDALIVYLEELSEGSSFMKVASRISRTKPFVLLRAGRFESGSLAIKSHTGSLAPENEIVEAACRQADVITVESARALFNMTKLFQNNVRKTGGRVAVVSNGGGVSAISADLIDSSLSLNLASFSPLARKKLEQVLPKIVTIRNPLDIIGDALSSRYAEVLKILTEEENIDVIMVIVTPQMMTEFEKTAHIINDFRLKKPILPVFMGGPSIEAGIKVLIDYGLANFNFPKDAIEALDALAQRDAKQQKKESDKLATKKSGQLRMLNYHDTDLVLKRVGIKLSGIYADSKAQLQEIFPQMSQNSPNLVLKAFSSEILHKSDHRAVKMDLTTVNDLELAWDEITAANAQVKIEGMLVQPKFEGWEIIIGMKRDELFGPVILFGLGGIYTEILKDFAIRIAPVNQSQAKEMITQIRGVKILQGARGQMVGNLRALAQLLVKISRLSISNPEIKEIDLNPVIVTHKSAEVVDARILV